MIGSRVLSCCSGEPCPNSVSTVRVCLIRLYVLMYYVQSETNERLRDQVRNACGGGGGWDKDS